MAIFLSSVPLHNSKTLYQKISSIPEFCTRRRCLVPWVFLLKVPLMKKEPTIPKIIPETDFLSKIVRKVDGDGCPSSGEIEISQ
jgi:hypothetical protein